MKNTWNSNVSIIKKGASIVSSVQSLSHVRLFATPWAPACQASLSIANSWSLLKLKSIQPVMPGFPGCSVVKNPASAEDVGSISLRRKWQRCHFQDSCLGNPGRLQSTRSQKHQIQLKRSQLSDWTTTNPQVKCHWNTARLITHCLQLLLHYNDRKLQSLKYWLSGPFQEILPISGQTLHCHCGPTLVGDRRSLAGTHGLWAGISRGSDTQPLSWMRITQGMVDECGHTGGCEGQLLLFAAFHGAQQEAKTLFRGRRLPSI